MHPGIQRGGDASQQIVRHRLERVALTDAHPGLRQIVRLVAWTLPGLKGKADYNNDKYISVDEVYHYVSEKVPVFTEQNQHPVKKGEVEGILILGIIEK